MENKHKVIYDFNFSLIADFFKGLERQGPGSEDITKLALQFVKGLPDMAHIADVGCGTGGQTIFLAQNLKGDISASDIMPEFIESLREKIRKAGLEDRITTDNISMAELDFPEQSLDLIWAEGSIYNIGYEKGLREWRKFLKPNGYIAVSEATWFTNERPQEIAGFWEKNYSEINIVSKKVQQMQDAGYTPVAHFILPEVCWWNYFNPILDYCEAFLQKHNYSEEAKGLVEHFKYEIELYDKYKAYYGYVFYIGQVNSLTDSEILIRNKKKVIPDLRIRQESEADYTEIYDLIRTAFETAKVKDGDEQDFAVSLRNSDVYIPELALVAEADKKLIGHIMLTKAYVETETGKEEFLLLAPISVLIDYRDKGIGSRLIEKSFELARQMGYKAVFLCGDPAYYHRFGFKPASLFGISPWSDIPEQYVMACELVPNALEGVSGVIKLC